MTIVVAILQNQLKFTVQIFLFVILLLSTFIDISVLTVPLRVPYSLACICVLISTDSTRCHGVYSKVAFMLPISSGHYSRAVTIKGVAFNQVNTIDSYNF